MKKNVIISVQACPILELNVEDPVHFQSRRGNISNHGQLWSAQIVQRYKMLENVHRVPCTVHRAPCCSFCITFSGIRPERWSIFQGNGMAMVVFLQRWNGDGLWKFLTITINGSWWDQPLATMVFRCFFFFQFWGPMVHDCYKLKFATNCTYIKTLKQKCKPSIYFSQMFYTFRKSHIFFRLLD